LFVSAVGLTGGSSVAEGLRGKNLISFIVGGVMVGVGILFMKLIGSLDANIDRSLLAGILCGALTSTPGLSAVCDVEKISSDLAVLGYGYAYLFGVIGVVMFVQLMSRRDCDKQKDIANRKEEKLKRSCNVLIPIGVSAVLGTAVGCIRLPFSDHSLGTSAGILCMSLAIGALMKKISVGYDAKNITFIRSLGLMMFFVGSGVPAGIRLSSGFDIKALLYGMILTVLPIFSGYIICRFLLKQKSSEVLCILAGGMTSTPAIGVLLGNPKLKPDLTVYSFAYIGALLAITVCIQFVC
jgi:putative transport protein